MASNRQWQEDLVKGKRSEAEAEAILRKTYGHLAFIVPVNDMEFQRLGGDYILYDKKYNPDPHMKYDKAIGVEVKQGVSTDHKILLEMKETFKDGTIKEGWFHTTQAGRLMFRKPRENDYFFVILEFKEFKQWILTDPMAKEYLTSTIIDRDGCKTSDCLWLDILKVKKDVNPTWILVIV